MAQHSFLQNLLQGQAVEWRALGEVCDILDNLRKPIKASLRLAGSNPYYGANNIQDYVDGFTHDGEYVLIAEDGSSSLENYSIQWATGKFWANNHVHVVSAKECLNNRFLFHFLKKMNFIPYLTGGTRAKLTKAKMIEIQIPIPPLSVQSQIVQILDTFTELNDQLTAELSMRQKQYQYYRNKLLTFDFEAVQSLATASDSGWHWYGRLWVRFLVNLGVGNQSIDLEMMKGYMEEAFHSFKLVILGVRQRKSKPITKHIAILVWLKVNYGKKIHYVSP